MGGGGGGGGLGSIGDVAMGVATGGISTVNNMVPGGILGDGQNAGILGLGQYKPQTYDVNKDAFMSNQGATDLRNQWAQQLAQVQGRAAPTIDQSQQAQFRAGQMQLMQDLQAQAAGQGPSLANLQLQQGTDNNIRQAMALGTTRQGVNPALAQRSIMNQATMAQQQAAQQAAVNRMQEQMAARQQLGGVMESGRGQDIGLATSQANLSQQQMGLNDAQARFYNTGMMDSINQEQANKMAYENLRANQAAGMNMSNQQAFDTAGKNRRDTVGKLGSAVAGGMFKGGVVKKKKMAEGGAVESEERGPDRLKKFGAALASSFAQPEAKKPEEDESPFHKGIGDVLKNKDKFAAAAPEAAAAAPMAHGGPVDMRDGGHIPGEPVVDGDSEENDIVPIMASPGEIMLPRTVAMDALKNKNSKKLTSFLEGLRKEHKMNKGGKVCMSEGGDVKKREPVKVDPVDQRFATAMRSAFGRK